MPQSLANVLVHLIFATKHRVPMIRRDLRPPLHGYIAGILANLRCPSLATGGTADHVHCLFRLVRTRALAEVAEELKRSSSKWIKAHGAPAFAWQAGDGAFSVSESQASAVVRYIATQEEHHRGLTFQEEFRRFL